MVIKNLIFEGSGINGMAYIGVIQELENKDLLSNIKYFAGASSGAFMATMICLGYTSIELEEMLKTLDIDEIVNTCYIKKIYNLIKGWGLHSREPLRKKLGELFEAKYHKDITFGELYQKTGKFLAITVTDIVNKTSIYVHPYSNPNCPVLDILLSSIASPIVFMLDKETYYVDGGITDNYPIWLFSDYDLLREEKYNKLRDIPIPKETLGIKIIEEVDREINNITSYILSIFNSMNLQLENVVRPDHYDRQTLGLLGKYDAFNFNLSDEEIDTLIEYGRDETKKFLNYQE